MVIILYIPLITYCAGFIIAAICSAVQYISEDESAKAKHRSAQNQQQRKGNDEYRHQAIAIVHQRYERKIEIWIEFNQYGNGNGNRNSIPIFCV